MDIISYLEQLPAGGQTQLARDLGVSPAYLYQMVKGIRPLSAERVIPLSKATSWVVTPHDLRPDIYPNPTDGLPADKEQGQAA